MKRRIFLGRTTAIGLGIALAPNNIFAKGSVQLQIANFKNTLPQIRHGLLELPQINLFKQSQKTNHLISADRNFFIDHGMQKEPRSLISCFIKSRNNDRDHYNMQISKEGNDFACLFENDYSTIQIKNETKSLILNEDLKLCIINSESPFHISLDRVSQNPIIFAFQDHSNIIQLESSRSKLEFSSSKGAFALLLDQEANFKMELDS